MPKKKKNKKKNQNKIIQRDPAKLAFIKGHIDLRTKSESIDNRKPKHNRKEKHKKNLKNEY